ncbi:MAG: hypothetical protein CL613_07130 [Aquimarina sp.]|jgi:hypothetical protein|nr:hypothetical protein [Aquimarina sp.]|tara:strand:- start:310 stop:1248 length:939 start_codon:yes stop_codon:yes gene_type:complete
MKNIEWKHLRGLHQLYLEGRTKLKIFRNDYINTVLLNQRKLIRFKTGNHSIIEATDRYKAFYELNFLETFNYYNTFFEKSGIENNAKKSFTEEDLKALMFIYYNKQELKEKLTTQKKFSAQVFKNQNSKYLENKLSLKNAVLDLLEIEYFPEKDPKNKQWRLVVDCLNPKVIVLCENLDCLKVPLEYKKNNIELWYVGGNNTKPLLDIPQEKLQLPIYYFCDWDFNGLKIYSQVKQIFKEKDKNIQIIEPLNNAKKLPVDVDHHKSKWKQKTFSGLIKDDFNKRQIDLIEQLISKDEWIEEESIDLLEALSL